MPGTTHILRVTLRSVSRRKVSLLRISPVHSRTFHVSQAALKKKGKTVQNDTLFDDNSEGDADDLFSASTPDPKSHTETTMPSKPEPLPRRRVSPSSETSLVDEKTAELLRQKEEARRHTFQSHYEYLYERTGDVGKRASALPAKRAVQTLVTLAISQEEWQRVIEIFRQWRRYPARSLPLSIHHRFIERAISTGHAPLVLDILTHRPIYGIDISSLSLARALLKSIITPAIAPPISEVDPNTHLERLGQALRLAEVLSISTIPVETHSSSEPPDSPESVEATQLVTTNQPELPTPSKPLTLSPTNDLILGSLLLSALLRVASLLPSTTTKKAESESAEPPTWAVLAEPIALAQAMSQFFTSLHGSPAYPQASIGTLGSNIQRSSLSGKEELWGIAALTECMVLLDSKSVRKLFEEINEVGVNEVSGEAELTGTGEGVNVEQMITWLGKARSWLVEDSSERGTIRKRVESILVKNTPAEGLPGTEGEKTGGDEDVSSHLLSQGNAQAEVRVQGP